MRKPLILAALAALAILGFQLFGPDVRDMGALRAELAAVESARAARPVLTVALFFLAYVIVTALSLPLAVWMTLAAGALFGFWTGFLLVSFAASIGATLAFLTARWLLRDWVADRLGERFAIVAEGVERDGAFYLFTLRLIPVVPFFAVNLLMGLTGMRTRTFYLVSQLGMLAGTAAYVNAGTRVAELESVGGILSAPILISFGLLAILPWLARALVGWLKRRRLYSRWTRPRRFDRNLIVIGAGAAGLVSAYIAAATKAKVTLVEAGKMGGDCLNYGCVPSKALIKAAKVAHTVRTADRFGVETETKRLSIPEVFARIDRVIEAIAPHDSVERYQGLGVDVRQGYARLIDPWTVAITAPDGTEARLTARAIVLATGAAPFVPPLPGLDQVGYLTSDTLWEALGKRDRAPARVAILGGGPIGCELAQAFARLGVNVSLIEMTARVLIREDEEVSVFARARLEEDGVEFLTGHKALSCGVEGSAKWIEVEAEGARKRVPFDDLIVAVGRAARLKGYGLEEIGIPTARVVETNDWLETLYPNIYAAGDAAGPFQFTHAAAHQAWFATVNALFGFARRFRVDYRVMPATTFLDPEIARVGLNEAEAQAKGIAYEVTRYGIDDLDRAITDGVAAGWVKVLTAPGKDRILGVTIVGEHAGDLLAEFVLAMKQGIGLNKILGTIHSYPTLAEANKFAAGEWRKTHLSPRALRFLERLHAWRRGA